MSTIGVRGHEMSDDKPTAMFCRGCSTQLVKDWFRDSASGMCYCDRECRDRYAGIDSSNPLARNTCYTCNRALPANKKDTWCGTTGELYCTQECYYAAYPPAITRLEPAPDAPLFAKALKADSAKLPLDLLDPLALEGIAAVLRFGAAKYSAHNWRSGFRWMRLMAALLRHAFAIIKGEDNDPESGLPHIDHLGCCWMFLSNMMKTRKDLDDRHKPVDKDPVAAVSASNSPN